MGTSDGNGNGNARLGCTIYIMSHCGISMKQIGEPNTKDESRAQKGERNADGDGESGFGS